MPSTLIGPQYTRSIVRELLKTDMRGLLALVIAAFWFCWCGLVAALESLSGTPFFEGSIQQYDAEIHPFLKAACALVARSKPKRHTSTQMMTASEGIGCTLNDLPKSPLLHLVAMHVRS